MMGDMNLAVQLFPLIHCMDDGSENYHKGRQFNTKHKINEEKEII